MKSEKMLAALEMEVQVVVSYFTWVLGTNFGFLVKAALGHLPSSRRILTVEVVAVNDYTRKKNSTISSVSVRLCEPS